MKFSFTYYTKNVIICASRASAPIEELFQKRLRIRQCTPAVPKLCPIGTVNTFLGGGAP